MKHFKVELKVQFESNGDSKVSQSTKPVLTAHGLIIPVPIEQPPPAKLRFRQRKWFRFVIAPASAIGTAVVVCYKVEVAREGCRFIYEGIKAAILHLLGQ